jgi:hypothetical protein
MALRPRKLGRMAIKQQAFWGTAETSFSATDYLECMVGDPVIVRDGERIDPIRAGFEEPEVLSGVHGMFDIPISFALHGWSTALPTGNPVEHPDGLLMKMALGSAATPIGYFANGVATGGSTSSLNFTAGSTAAATWCGNAMVIPTSGTPGYELFVAKTFTDGTPDVIVPKVVLQRTPASSGHVYGSLAYYLSTATQLPVTLDWLGLADADHHIRYPDVMVRSLRVTGKTRVGPMVEATLRVTGAPTFPGGGGAMAAYSYGYPRIPQAVKASGAALYFNGSWRSVSEVTFAVENTLGDSEEWYTDTGIGQQAVTDRKVSVTVTVPSTASFASELLNPGTAVSGMQCIFACDTPGRAAAFDFGTPVLTKVGTLGSRNELLAVTYEVAPQVYAGDTGVGSGAGNKGARFFFA